LNVWASWCVSCRDEHPLLVNLAKSGVVPIYGLNYKDRRDDALAWLARFGNPYAASVSDAEGKVGIDYGVYGVPETYIVDDKGMIRHKHIGPITPEVLEAKILPLVKELNAKT
jgi:cytochrome c biogenesis protein CcmG, thiol:disulfide interchange protein DsbE